jgi:cellobiose-specific phosphotransferase system component IIA
MPNLDLITEDLDNRFALEMAGEKDQDLDDRVFTHAFGLLMTTQCLKKALEDLVDACRNSEDQESMEIVLSNAEDALKEAFNAKSTSD